MKRMWQNRYPRILLIVVLLLILRFSNTLTPKMIDGTAQTSTVSAPQSIIFPSVDWLLSLPAERRIADWPLPMPSVWQIKEVQTCDLENGPSKRYPFFLLYETEFPTNYLLVTACDWAILAAAFGRDLPDAEVVSGTALRTFYETTSRNPAFAFTPTLIWKYAGRKLNTFVKPPPFAKLPIVRMDVHYELTQLLSYTTSYGYSVDQADTDHPSISITINGKTSPNPPGNLDIQRVQYIGPTLVNLIPVSSPVSLKICPVNKFYILEPKLHSWRGNLLFKDGSEIKITSNGSLSSQIQIGTQLYFQYYSTDLWTWLDSIAEDLGLPAGESLGSCDDFQDALRQAYPQFKFIGQRK